MVHFVSPVGFQRTDRCSLYEGREEGLQLCYEGLDVGEGSSGYLRAEEHHEKA